MLKRSTIFSNSTINKRELKKIIEWAFKNYGQRKAAYFVDQLKEMGFEYATKSGISLGIEDLRIPPVKLDLMRNASSEALLTESQAKNGEITEVERFQRIIYIWNTTSEELKERLIEFFKKTDPSSPFRLFLIINSKTTTNAAAAATTTLLRLKRETQKTPK